MDKLSNLPESGKGLSKNNSNNSKIGPDVTVSGTPIIPCPFANWRDADGQSPPTVDHRKPFVLSELHRASLRCRLWAADLDSIGVALRADLISSEQALELLDPGALAFVGLREEGGAS